MTRTWSRQVVLVLTATMVVGCGGGSTTVTPDDVGVDSPQPADTEPEFVADDTVIFAETGGADTPEDSVPWDLKIPEDTDPGCEAGEGCFLDPCSENDECLSGWCVEHMGQKVCSQTCQEECPEGWSCLQVDAGGRDVVFICVSNVPNLCRPCTAASDCEGLAGTEDACVVYGDEGAFCGGKCGDEAECPGGFTCQTVTTVDGIELDQCVNDDGICDCTETSIELGLFTHCVDENEFGLCQG